MPEKEHRCVIKIIPLITQCDNIVTTMTIITNPQQNIQENRDPEE